MLKLFTFVIALCAFIGSVHPSVAIRTKNTDQEALDNKTHPPKKQKKKKIKNSKKSKNAPILMECPVEILLHILDSLPIPDQVHVRRICKTWKSLIDTYFLKNQQFLKGFQTSILKPSHFISFLNQLENEKLSHKQLDFLRQTVQNKTVNQKNFERILREGTVEDRRSFRKLLEASCLLERVEGKKKLSFYTLPARDMLKFIKEEWYVYFSKPEDLLTVAEAVGPYCKINSLDIPDMKKFLTFFHRSIFEYLQKCELSPESLHSLRGTLKTLLDVYYVNNDFEKILLLLRQDPQKNPELWELFSSDLSERLLSNTIGWSSRDIDFIDDFIRSFPHSEKNKTFHLLFYRFLLKFFSIQKDIAGNQEEKILKLLKDRYVPHTFPEAYYLARTFFEGHNYKEATKKWRFLLYKTEGQEFHSVIIKKYCESLLCISFNANSFAQAEKLIKSVLLEFEKSKERNYIYKDENNSITVKIKRESILTLNALLMFYNGKKESEIAEIFKQLKYINLIHLFRAIRHRGFFSLKNKTKETFRELIIKSCLLVSKDTKKQKSLSSFKDLFLEIFGDGKTILKQYEKFIPFFGLEKQTQKNKKKS